MLKLPEDLPDCTVFLLGKAYQKAHGDFKKMLKPYGLTNMQHLVLEALWYLEGMTAAELCTSLVLDKATLSGVLERMTQGGWIIKKTDPRDRRIHRIYTSKKADDLKEELVEVRKTANEMLLSRFTAEEGGLLKRLLRGLIE